MGTDKTVGSTAAPLQQLLPWDTNNIVERALKCP